MSSLRASFFFAVFSSVSGIAVAPPPALAQEAPDAATVGAREAFDRGVRLYGRAQYAEALESFQAAFELRPHPSVRVNIANCLARLGRAVEATYHFQRYLQERGDEVTAQQRADVQHEIDGLRAQVGVIEVAVDPPEAEIFVDDTRPEARIGQLIYVSTGRHVVEARQPGLLPAREELDVPGGTSWSVRLVLSPVDAGGRAPGTRTPEGGAGEETPAETHQAAASLSTDDEGPHVMPKWFPWIGAGTTAVSLTIALALSASALSAESEFDSVVADLRAADASGQELTESERRTLQHNGREWADAANTRALVADVFYVLTLALAAGTTYLFLTADDAESTDVAVGAVPLPAGGAFVLSGSFGGSGN